ncbi:glycosyltransferase, partial [Candidatus Parcubacteria bacterium]|nr:glycosyltransferase [Candidatus Parcubacteria bacterium]
KLDVMLLLEENDQETINAAEFIGLPEYVRTIIIPHSNPKTKPKACNYGLSMARGKYVVIYDAEDEPDPAQLKKAYLGFLSSPDDIRCLQAKLNYYNSRQNLLTRLFTAEYSLWFDVVLPGLQTIGTSIPLGGTSNHFRTKDLLELEGWDPFNVTEDCDLGVRIFKRGYKTAIIDSVTLEEANSQAMNWLRQRSRWIKGYMQTYLVHMRQPVKFIKESGIHAFIFQLVVGGKVAFMIINPFLWLTTIAYFAFYSLVGQGIEALYPPLVFYIAATSLIVGNFLYIYYYMIGCARRGHWGLIKYVFFIPVYWLMVSVAAVIAFYQLLTKPHYWEKTQHGLHIKAPAPSSGFFPQLLPVGSRQFIFAPVLPAAVSAKTKRGFSEIGAKIFAQSKDYFKRMLARADNDPLTKFNIAIQKGGSREPKKEAGKGLIKKQAINKLVGLLKSEEGVFVAAMMLANFINFFFNAYLGRVLDFENLGLITFINTLWYLAMVFIAALGTTINHQASYLAGSQNEEASAAFLLSMTQKALKVVLAFSLVWIISAPWLAGFFNIPDYWILVLITPAFPFGIILYSNFNFLKGVFRFRKAALILLLEAATKLLLAIGLVWIGRGGLVFAVIPASIALVSIWTVYAVRKHLPKPLPKQKFVFPGKFFTSSFMAGLSAIAFLSLDIILAKHFLSPRAAGEYALLSLIGKMIYFGGALPNQFMMSFVSRNEGKQKSSQIIFRRIFIITLFIVCSGIVILGIFGATVTPFLFGDKIKAVAAYLPLYTTAIALFTLTSVIVSFQLARKRYYFTKVSLFFSLTMAVGIIYSHASIDDIVFVITAVSAGAFFTVSALHLIDDYTVAVKENIKDFFRHSIAMFPRIIAPPHSWQDHAANSDLKKILIFNWRDTRHAYAGGAELYIQEMAKRWVKQGTKVTIFCGNDGLSPRQEIIDGIKIIRRGGFYLVYVWAFIYYFLFFRNKYDVIIDCQNGIPFFTPLYAKEPVYCLMHHVHQEVFRKSLIKPLAALAMFLEKDLMPLVYKKVEFITVSESSKKAMIKLGLGNEGISVVNPGIDTRKLRPAEKHVSPVILYLGRLKEYKSIDNLIKAFHIVLKFNPAAKLAIVGSGEEENKLRRLSKDLQIQDRVYFTGQVSEADKLTLLQKSWVAVNPSLMEGWGITTIEANACGTPVIASDVPGLRDSVVDDHTGYLIEYGNTEKLSAKIVELIVNKVKLETMSNYASIWARKYDWHYSALHFFNIISNDLYTKELKNNFILRLLARKA